MADVAAFSILALTVSLSLARPRIGGWHVDHASAAVVGALLVLATGLVPPGLALATIGHLAFPIVTIVSLMTMTLVAERAGLLRQLAHDIGANARGSGKRLFSLIFAAGTLAGTVFTNDAAVLIFTPLVFQLVEEAADDSWGPRQRVPYYFAVLYIGNLVGALVTSNPINIVVASFFDIGFAEYAAWMSLPAAISMLVSYVGLRICFRDSLPASCRRPTGERPRVPDAALARICLVVLALTLIGFFSEGWTGMPTWLVALAGATVSLIAYERRGGRPMVVLRGVGWDVIVFVVGIFLVVLGVRNAGFAHHLGHFISTIAGDGMDALVYTTGFIAGACSSIMNNHPTAGLMIWVIQDFDLGELETKMLVFSALVGGDLGPKMLPIGSLAALMWFRMLRQRGVEISYALYVRLGIPITLAAIASSLVALNAERIFVDWLGR